MNSPMSPARIRWVALSSAGKTFMVLLAMILPGALWQLYRTIFAPMKLFPAMRFAAVTWTKVMCTGLERIGCMLEFHGTMPNLDRTKPLLILAGHPETFIMPWVAWVCHMAVKWRTASAAKQEHARNSLGWAAWLVDSFIFVKRGGGLDAAVGAAKRTLRHLIAGVAVLILPEAHRPTDARLDKSREHYPHYKHLTQSLYWHPGLIQSIVDAYGAPMQALVFFPICERKLWGKWFDMLQLLAGTTTHIVWYPKLVTFNPNAIEETKETLLVISKAYEKVIAEHRVASS